MKFLHLAANVGVVSTASFNGQK